MLRLTLDPTGAFGVRWPASPEALGALGEAYVEKSLELPVEERVSQPAVEEIADLVTTAKAALAGAGSGEVSRAGASGTYNGALDQAIPELRIAIRRLKGQYAENLGRLEAWGIPTHQTAFGVTAQSPKGRKGWAKLLVAYMQQEASLPEEQRVASPSYASMAELAGVVASADASRSSSKQQREQENAALSEAFIPLHDRMQVACAVLVIWKFGGRVTRDL